MIFPLIAADVLYDTIGNEKLIFSLPDATKRIDIDIKFR